MDAKTAFAKIQLLQELTAATGTQTTRVQGKILQSLSDADLLTVAAEMKRSGLLQKALAPLRGEANAVTSK